LLARGSDDVEVARSSNRDESLSDGMDEAPVAAHQSRNGHALNEGAPLDTCFEDVGGSTVEATEECVEAAQHSFDHGVGGCRRRLETDPLSTVEN
jgi:hypothetical protein